MNILICNVGSTSLKYQLFAMEQNEAVLYKGGAERVSQKNSVFYVTDPISGKKQQRDADFPTHLEAIEAMLDDLPEDASLSVPSSYLAHVADRREVYELAYHAPAASHIKENDVVECFIMEEIQR